MSHDLDNPRLVIALGVVLPALLITPLGGGSVELAVRVAAALPLLLMPGHALLLALRPAWSVSIVGTERCIGLERWAWTIGTSLAVSALGAFALNMLPSGLERKGWAVFLGAITVIAAAVAAARSPWPAPPRRGARSLSRIRVHTMTLAVPALIAAAAVGIGVRSALDMPTQSFAQLWLVPQPVSAIDGGPRTAAIGVKSFEDSTSLFRLELHATGAGAPLGVWTFDLAPGAEWRQVVPLVRDDVRAELYRGAEPQPYRQVWLNKP